MPSLPFHIYMFYIVLLYLSALSHVYFWQDLNWLTRRRLVPALVC